jgi:hypothetical protein
MDMFEINPGWGLYGIAMGEDTMEVVVRPGGN